jgi:hypothetical protein
MDSVQEDYLSEGEKRSLLSRPSETVSSLSDSKGMILENPDGTFYHGISRFSRLIQPGVLAGRLGKGSDCDNGGYSLFRPQNLILNRFPNYPRNRILYIVDDDEIALYAGFYDLPTTVDEFLALYLRHQRYFVIFLVFFMLYELMLLYMAYENQALAVDEVLFYKLG